MSAAELQARIQLSRGPFTLDVDLTVPAGQIVSILGPNGAGKSTLLAVLAGLLPIREGRVQLDEQVLDDPAASIFRRPERRPIGVVFQDYRLFPHQSVLENVAFGARARGVSKSIARTRAREWLEKLDLSQFADRRPGALSGGQAQRVALARALATEPAMLLLDEPLAALDARSRREVQRTLATYLREFAGPVLMVTHDPVDALLLADRLVVVEDGRIRQDASPETVSTRPASAYVAQLLDLNLYRGTVQNGRFEIDDGGGTLIVTAIDDSDSTLAVVRPSAITVHRERPLDSSARNIWPVIVRSLTRLPDRVRVEVDGRPSAIVDVTAAAVEELGLTEGAPAWLSAKATDIHSWSETSR
ncbi:MAG: transporter related protein [Pseudonocardiales bacterium]|nr:transporter related protein [Pseudonocardiales bacterium]